VKIRNGKVPVEIIDSKTKLHEIVKQLHACTELYIDTEFDEFKTQYGVHLQLIQVFDGACCYLVDPLLVTELDELWAIFEDEKICKVFYAASGDIGILKNYGCHTKNIFDIQIAAFLCNRAENSFSSLVQAELGIEIDKSCQTSRWGDRPLTNSQLLYASNDVIHLLHLKQALFQEVASKDLLQILIDENALMENCTKKTYEPKLTPKQKKMFTHYAREIMMEFKNLVNEYAKLLNLPLFYIVQDSLIEEIIKDPTAFLTAPFAKGFHKDAASNELFKQQFLNIVHSIDITRKRYNPLIERADTLTNHANIKINNRFAQFKEYIIHKYGETAGTVLLKGLSKKITDESIEWEGTREYQQDLYRDYLAGE